MSASNGLASKKPLASRKPRAAAQLGWLVAIAVATAASFAAADQPAEFDPFDAVDSVAVDSADPFDSPQRVARATASHAPRPVAAERTTFDPFDLALRPATEQAASVAPKPVVPKPIAALAAAPAAIAVPPAAAPRLNTPANVLRSPAIPKPPRTNPAAKKVQPLTFHVALQESIPTPGSVRRESSSGATADHWQPTPLHQLTTDIRLPGGMLPRDYAAERPAHDLPAGSLSTVSRGWPLTTNPWKASGLKHRPLYFEEINLERYGYGYHDCLQYGVSAAHFFATVPALPYFMAFDCPCQCNYTLGHYRPGSCPPRRAHWMKGCPL